MGEEAQVIKYQKLRKIRFIRTIIIIIYKDNYNEKQQREDGKG